MNTDQADASASIPPKPQEPEPHECCMSGCEPCIYDYYYRALAEWEEQVTALGLDPAKIDN